MLKKHKNIILFGSPGAGKTTQIDMLEEAGVDFALVSVGQILREVVKSGSDLGRKIDSEMKKGNLVDDNMIIRLVKDKLRDIDKDRMLILDGYPRSLNQVNVVDDIFEENELELPIMIYIKITEEEAFRRLGGRRVCSQCKENFQISELENKEKCPKCGGDLITRADDTREAINTRFEIFGMQLEILQYYFQKRNRYFEVDGMNGRESTHKQIMEILEK